MFYDNVRHTLPNSDTTAGLWIEVKLAESHLEEWDQDSDRRKTGRSAYLEADGAVGVRRMGEYRFAGIVHLMTRC